jgi:phosphate transport system permease protein
MTTATATRSEFAKASGSRRFKNNLATTVVTLCFLVALIPLIWVLWTVISNGLTVVLHASWWTGTTKNIESTDPGGGALAAIIGTLEQVALCTVISVPIAVLVGVYLVEYGTGPLARVTTFMVDIMTGIPSIVAALFIFALAIQSLGLGAAGWLVSLALVILMVPVIVRTTEEMLKLVPNELREASYALGVPKWKTIMKIVIPTAFTGLVTGVVLGIARVAGETAPLLILVGYADGTNSNLFSGFQAALPTLIREQFRNAGQSSGGATAYHLDENGNRVAGGIEHFSADRMWAAALTLIVIVLLLNITARFIGRFNKVAK